MQDLDGRAIAYLLIFGLDPHEDWIQHFRVREGRIVVRSREIMLGRGAANSLKKAVGLTNGKTDADGHKVEDGEMKAGDLFATIFAALGVDYKKEYHVGARPIPIVDFGCKPVPEVLA